MFPSYPPPTISYSGVPWFPSYPASHYFFWCTLFPKLPRLPLFFVSLVPKLIRLPLFLWCIPFPCMVPKLSRLPLFLVVYPGSQATPPPTVSCGVPRFLSSPTSNGFLWGTVVNMTSPPPTVSCGVPWFLSYPVWHCFLWCPMVPKLPYLPLLHVVYPGSYATLSPTVSCGVPYSS